MKTLTDSIFFMVRAVDFRENISNESAVLGLERPDIMPPSKPILRRDEIREDAVTFAWVLAPDEDVIHHKFQRKQDDRYTWITIHTIPAGVPDTMYTDETFDPDYNYTYRLIAEDEVGNQSGSALVPGKPAEPKPRHPIDDPAGAVTGLGIVLKWGYPDVNNVQGFQIYRKVDNGPLREYKFIRVADGAVGGTPAPDYDIPGDVYYQFIDKHVVAGSIYTYQILAKSALGFTSPITDELVIQN